jgi:hypothetical protein
MIGLTLNQVITFDQDEMQILTSLDYDKIHHKIHSTIGNRDS